MIDRKCAIMCYEILLSASIIITDMKERISDKEYDIEIT